MKKISILFVSLLLVCATMVTTTSAATSSTNFDGEPDKYLALRCDATESAISSVIRLNATQKTPDDLPLAKPVPINPDYFAFTTEVRDENGPVSTLAANQTYTLRVTISPSGQRDAQNTRVRLTDFARIEGYMQISGKTAVPMLYVYGDGLENRTACAKVSIIDSERLRAQYVPSSATLTLGDGTTVMILDDDNFMSGEGARIGTGSADGNLLVGSHCTVEYKFMTTEYGTTPSTSKLQPADRAPTVAATKPANPQPTPDSAAEESVRQDSAVSNVLVANDHNFSQRLDRLDQFVGRQSVTQAISNVGLLIVVVILAYIVHKLKKRVKQLEGKFYDSEDPSLDPPDEDQPRHDDEDTASDLDATRRFEWDPSELDDHADHKVD